MHIAGAFIPNVNMTQPCTFQEGLKSWCPELVCAMHRSPCSYNLTGSCAGSSSHSKEPNRVSNVYFANCCCRTAGCWQGRAKRPLPRSKKYKTHLRTKKIRIWKELQTWTLGDCSQNLLSLRAEEGALLFLGMPWPQQTCLCTELERLKPKHDASLKQKVCHYFTYFTKPPSHSFISDVTVNSVSLLDKT